MTKEPERSFKSVMLGKRFSELKDTGDQVSYLAINAFLLLLAIPLTIVNTTYVLEFGLDFYRFVIKSVMIFLCLFSVFILRVTRIPLHFVPALPVTFFALYWLYLLYAGDFSFWAAVWLLAVPPIAILTCGKILGTIQSAVVLAAIIFFTATPFAPNPPGFQIALRFILFYFFIFMVVVIDERIQGFTVGKERSLSSQLLHERGILATMEDNIPQGVFRMDQELKILPLYSKPLISILSYYDSELAGRSFLDILSSSLTAQQLQIMRGYFAMIFSKSKSAKVLESANPISEFEYIADGRRKTLSTRFVLVEQEGADPIIIAIIEDISREKEFEKELQAQKEAQELEMRSMFDVIQIDPTVFHDFIDDTEADFNYINTLLKDKNLNERQVVTRFFQSIHAIKSNALILGLETFAAKLHALEDSIKEILSFKEITLQDTFALAVKLEMIMQEKDSYLTIVKKIEAFKSSNQVDAVLVHSMQKAVERISIEAQKKVELKVGEVDLDVLGSKMRKPIKDILLQCIRNAIYHGIEPVDERLRKNKSPTGVLSFSLKKVANRIELTFSDDGRGLNLEKIKLKYLQLHPGSADVSRPVLLSSIFAPEFSTAEVVTSTAGRGVGLSLVRDLVKELQGSININYSDSGLAFKFTFPLSAAA